MKMIRHWKIKVAAAYQVANFPKVGNFNSSGSESRNGLSSIFKVANLGKVGNLLIAGNFNSSGSESNNGLSSISKVANLGKVGNLFVFLCCYILIACSSGKSNIANENLQTSKPPLATIPPCIQHMIDSAKKQPGGMSITEIRRYIYNGAKVYLVAAPCCDQFNPLYDSACNYLFAPSGGFTGKGDRSNPDFFTQAKEDSLIWKEGK